ncbi:MAG: substrate-binding domain-containing protein [bacterium]|nr:substrate-binding domain-containing protein [bacterium]
MHLRKRRTRPPAKQQAIVEYVRSAILDGTLRPGDRLQPRNAIGEQFEVSSVTVQRAFDRLLTDGFIDVPGSDGTFVAMAPPHLCRYAIAFRQAIGGGMWSQWFAGLMRQATALEARAERTLPIYTEVDDRVKSEGYERLTRDIRDHCVAGVVFVGETGLAPDSPILTQRGLSRVVLKSSSFEPIPGTLRVDLGGPTTFLKKALDYLAAKGRKRIAHICVGGIESERLDFLHHYASELGLETAPFWTQGVGVDAPAWAANVTHLMYQVGQADYPDGLIISDDNLVEHACRGLVEAGVSVPGDVEVVAHCNFPATAPSVLQLARLGYDTRTSLETCLELIDGQNQGREVPEYTLIEPVFEWELDGASRN